MKRKSEQEIMAAKVPEDIFTLDPIVVVEEKDDYLKRFRTEDYRAVRNFMITRKILFLYQDAVHRIGKGITDDVYDSEYLFEITVEGEKYQFFENVFEGEVAYVFKGTHNGDTVYMKLAINPEDNVFLENEYEVLSGLKHQSLPVVLHKLQANDTCAIIMNEVRGISMIDLMKQYPKGVPAKHVMWMLERLLSVIGYLHSKCIVHGNIKPENIIINKANHNVTVLGFSFCIPNSNIKGAEYKISNDYYTAPEVCKEMIVLPSSDIYSIGKIAQELLGGDVKTSMLPDNIDMRVQEFIEKMMSASYCVRPDDAWVLWSELIKLRTQVFGTERFQEMN